MVPVLNEPQAAAEAVSDSKRINMLSGALVDAAVDLRLAQGGLQALGANDEFIRRLQSAISNVEHRLEAYGDQPK